MSYEMAAAILAVIGLTMQVYKMGLDRGEMIGRKAVRKHYEQVGR